MKKQRTLNIHHLLRAADQCDGEWLSQQDDAVRKEFTPLVAMRWAATVADGPAAGYMLYMINERVNSHLFALARHPDLTYRLIASCGLGKALKHAYLPAASITPAGNAATNLLRERFPCASDVEINVLLSLFDRASFIDYVNDCGVQPDEAKGIIHGFERLRPDQALARKTKTEA